LWRLNQPQIDSPQKCGNSNQPKIDSPQICGDQISRKLIVRKTEKCQSAADLSFHRTGKFQTSGYASNHAKKTMLINYLHKALQKSNNHVYTTIKTTKRNMYK